MMSARHFLSLMDCTPEELVSVIRRGIELKDLRNRGVLFEPLKNRVLGMIFEKSSTRTRVSFEAGMIQLVAKPSSCLRATPNWVVASRSPTAQR
jgi:ornithine carbamoyltransferase